MHENSVLTYFFMCHAREELALVSFQKRRKTWKTAKNRQFTKLDKRWTNIEGDVEGEENNILTCFFMCYAMGECIETRAQEGGKNPWKTFVNFKLHWSNKWESNVEKTLELKRKMGTTRVQTLLNQTGNIHGCCVRSVFALPARENILKERKWIYLFR